MKMKLLAPVLLLAMTLAGCNDFERAAFQSLSASKAVLDQAQADYEAHALPQTQLTFSVITQAKQAQATAVDALLAYEAIKSAKGGDAALRAQQAVVATALAQVAASIGDVKVLATGTDAAPTGVAPHAIPPPAS